MQPTNSDTSASEQISSENNPAVLGAQTSSQPAKNLVVSNDDLKIPTRYYMAFAIIFLLGTIASYVLKQRY